jgi:hypothetical protein
MPERCTCGAQLLPDAVFCHKCGRPVRELPGDAEPESTGPIPAAAPAPYVPPPPPPVSFHNRVAVRIAFWVALMAMVVTRLNPILTVLVWAAAGFMAVYLYRRQTGTLVNVRSGMTMGWITGVILFAMLTVSLTVELLVAQGREGGVVAQLRQQMQNSGNPNVKEALRVLDTPSGLATILVVLLLMMFLFITLFSVAGGALGATFSGRRSQQN